MIQVEESPKALALLGLIESRYRGTDRLYDLNAARNRLLMKLRECHPIIWTTKSPIGDHISVWYDLPLGVHFRWIYDDKIGVVEYEEVKPNFDPPPSNQV